MCDARFEDGTPQPLYFPDGHPHAGSSAPLQQLTAAAVPFWTTSWISHMLRQYWKLTARIKAFRLFFYPNFTCWGYAKWLYRLNPKSSQEAILEKNTIAVLNVVPLELMCRFANRSRRFMDTYQKGLNGSEAAWASRKYRGHHVLPESLMEDMEKAKLH
ncbi:uncharacterized protein LACBIDRAFT_331788 [Laccaria bicolor S238N-H82]|uniref:Predicted protein n=1 Tax=Laccaria bicolor (strain S238N-H82 / ATCC MYA-4686) TaxID=486041 RepID=B0DQK4_LACBS|nr:uncharacterized protein LACBIDRAFT_331788 [Laccaria bicolor S238N-H82]EDR03129.1 predicted protein [Laccaria bicolor S238N-H82]|eukprot:XP_001886270.1 predicted protein [Laccaria bicolor S238N-H82]